MYSWQTAYMPPYPLHHLALGVFEVIPFFLVFMLKPCKHFSTSPAHPFFRDFVARIDGLYVGSVSYPLCV